MRKIGLSLKQTLSLEMRGDAIDDSPHIGVYSAEVRDWMKDVKMCAWLGLPIPNPPKQGGFLDTEVIADH